LRADEAEPVGDADLDGTPSGLGEWSRGFAVAIELPTDEKKDWDSDASGDVWTMIAAVRRSGVSVSSPKTVGPT